MRRKLAVLLVLSMIFNLLPMSVFASSGESEKITYDVQRWYEDLNGQKIHLDTQSVATSSDAIVKADLSDPGFGDKYNTVAPLDYWYPEEAESKHYNAGKDVEISTSYADDSHVIKMMAKTKEEHPAADKVTINANGFPDSMFPHGYEYDPETGTVTIHISPKAVDAYVTDRQAFVIQIDGYDGWTKVDSQKDGILEVTESGLVRAGFRIKGNERKGLYFDMIDKGWNQNETKGWIKFRDQNNELHYVTMKVVLKRDDSLIPGTNELNVTTGNYASSFTYAGDGKLGVTLIPANIQAEIATSGHVSVDAQLTAPEISGKTIAKYQVNDETVKTLTGGKASFTIPVTKEVGGNIIVMPALSQKSYEVSWYDEGGVKLGYSSFNLTYKYKDSGKSVDFIEADGSRVSFLLDCWPEGEQQPFTVEHKDGFYTLIFDMTEDDWQKAYNNRSPGEDSLYVRVVVTPVANAVYGKTEASNDAIGEKDEDAQKSIVNVLTNKQGVQEVSRHTFQTKIPVAAILDNGTTATINPKGRPSHMLSLAWEDALQELINLSDENITYCEYVRFGIRHDNLTPVQISTKDFKTDGSTITLDAENDFEDYILYTTYVNNSINYYLDGEALAEKLKDDPSFILDHSTITTGFTAPDNAVKCVIGNDNNEDVQTFNFTSSERTANYKVNITESRSTLRYKRFYNVKLYVSWTLEDGTKVADHPLAIRVSVVYNENAYDEAGWNRVEEDRFVLPESLNGTNGVAIDVEDGHLHTIFTGEKINPVWQDTGVKVGVKVPQYDEPILKYEYSEWEGSGVNEDLSGKIQEVIGVNVKYDLNDEDTIWFHYDGVPQAATIVEGDVQREIYTGKSFGNYEDTAGWKFVRWYGANDKVLGTEWFCTTADDCYTTEYYDGVDSVDEKVSFPTLLDSDCKLKVEYFTTGKTDDSDRTVLYVRMYPVDGKLFEVYKGAEKVIWPYESGMSLSNISDYDFKAYHYTDASHSFHGDLKYTFLEEGIELSMNSFSPFLLTWKEVSTPPYTPSGDDDGGSSSTPVVKPDQAVTPIKTAEDGKQLIGNTTISLPASKLTEEEKKSYVETGKWNKDKYGRWQLKDAAGSVFKSCWALVSDKLCSKSVGNASWYFFDANGYMLTGWQQIPGADGKKYWYYFNKEDGSMYGACLMNGTTPDGSKVNEKGQKVDADGKPVTK